MLTITGGFIVKEQGSSITYKFKCDNCNYVDPNDITLTLTKGVTEISVRRCPCCGKSQLTKIKPVADKQTVS